MERLRQQEEKVTIKKMPSKRMLEEFVADMHRGEVKVYFDMEKGEFKWSKKGENEK